jgi:hypothetical protein
MTAREGRRRHGGACALALALALAQGATVGTPQIARAAAWRAPVRQQMTVTVQNGPSGAVIPATFLGLSWETTALASPLLAPPSAQLAQLLRGLGPGLLRISGVSVDRTRWSAPAAASGQASGSAPGSASAPASGQAPTAPGTASAPASGQAPTAPGTAPAPWQLAAIGPPDLEHLGALMRESGWRLLLGLDLGHLEAPALVQEAAAASAMLGGSLAGVQIGNEPDLFTRVPSAPFRALLGDERLREPPWGLQQYETEITSLRGALAAGGAAAPLYGPDTAGPAWLASYAQVEGRGLAALAQHYYPLDRCSGGRLLEHGARLVSLLGTRVALDERRLLASLVRLAAGSGLPLRIDEANSVACAGQPHVSDTFGAALWALDFSLLAAREGVSGINFHGGLGLCGAGGIGSPWYSPLCSLPGGQVHVRPEYYALLALRSLEGCAFVPVSYTTPANAAVFALRAPDGSLRVVVDDMELASSGARRSGARHGGARRGGARAPAPLRVTLSAGPSFTRATVLRLSAPAASSSGGATFGGAAVALDGSFAGAASQPVRFANGAFAVTVKPASAALLTISAAP